MGKQGACTLTENVGRKKEKQEIKLFFYVSGIQKQYRMKGIPTYVDTDSGRQKRSFPIRLFTFKKAHVTKRVAFCYMCMAFYVNSLFGNDLLKVAFFGSGLFGNFPCGKQPVWIQLFWRWPFWKWPFLVNTGLLFNFGTFWQKVAVHKHKIFPS